MLRIVAATELDEDAYRTERPLPPSIERLGFGGGVVPDIAFKNRDPLPKIYNAALDRAEEGDTILFTHDDVKIDDWFLARRLEEALRTFDVVGVAGNGVRVSRQWSWYSGAQPGVWAYESLSGAVAHGGAMQGRVTLFGPTPAPALLMDGVFLASKVSTLRRAGVRFDPRFAFHFYDLDFCRACEQAGLAMGTWPIAITHASGGAYGTPEWTMAFHKYLAKWRE